MSQRIKTVDSRVDVVLNLSVNVKSLSNHDGFEKEQVQSALEEFDSKIRDHLLHKLTTDYETEEFLLSTDFVTYSVEESKNLKQ